jgi:hypothetical protein
LALQNQPPITNNTETIEMVKEVGLDNVKIALDLPLIAKQDDNSIVRVGRYPLETGRRFLLKRLKKELRMILPKVGLLLLLMLAASAALGGSDSASRHSRDSRESG